MKVNSAFDLLVKTKLDVCETVTITPFKLGFKTKQKKKTKITNQGNSTGKYNKSLKANSENNKSRQIPYNKSLKESRKGASQIYNKNAKNNNYNKSREQH